MATQETLENMRSQRAALLDAELARLVDELKHMGADLIVLFGSYAKGRRDLFTDLDLLVVIESDKPFVERLPALYATLAPKVAADILVYTPQEFLEMKERRFLRHALANGVVLHASR
jgi:predicted nucleotidyltransferase